MEFLRYFYRCRVKLVLSLVVMLVIGVYAGIKLYPPKYFSEMDVVLTFAGIDKGLTPNGSAFSPQQLISSELLEQTSMQMNERFKTSKFKDVISHIGVEAVIPQIIKDKMKAAEKNKQDFSYYPCKWRLSFVISDRKAFTNHEMDAYLQQLVVNIKNNYIEESNAKNIVPVQEIEPVVATQMDLLDKIGVLRNLAVATLQNIENFTPASGFVSKKNGVSFAQIKLALRNLIDARMPKVEFDLVDALIAGSTDPKAQELGAGIRRLGMEVRMYSNEAAAAEKLLNGMATFKTDSASGENKIEIPCNEQTFDYLRKTSTQYMLTDKALTARNMASKSMVEYDGLIRKLKTDGYNRGYGEKLAALDQDVNALGQDILRQAILANSTYEEYLVSAGNSVVVVTKWPENASFYGSMLKVLACFLMLPLLVTFLLAMADQFLKETE